MLKTQKNELNLSVVLSYVCLFANVAGSLVVTPVLVSRFGQVEYGLYMLAYSMGMYMNVDGMGIGGVVVRQVQKYLTLGETQKREGFIFQSLLIFLLLGAVAFAVLYGISLMAGSIFAQSVQPENIRRLKWMLNLTAVNCALLFVYNHISSVITGYNKLVFIKSVTLLKIVTRPLVVIGFIGRLQVDALVLIDLAITLALVLLAGIYAVRVLGVKLRPCLDGRLFRRTLSKTSFVFASLVSDNVCWNSGSMMVAMFFGEASAGVYSIAMTLCGVFSQFSASISGLFLPNITSLVVKKSSSETLLNKMIETGRYLLSLLVLVIIGFGLLGKEFLVMYLGEAFLPAYTIALPLMIVLLYPSTQLVGDSVIQAMNRFSARSAIQLLSSITTLVLGALIIPRLGLEGSWVGLAVSVVIFRIVVTNVFLQRLGLNMRTYFAKTIPKMALLCAILIPVLWLCVSRLGLGFIANGVLIVFAYAIAVWFFYLNRPERRALSSLFKKGNA